MQSVTGTAYSRAGLLGNPSDGYGGQAIALSLGNFRAQVTLAPADTFELVPGATDLVSFPSVGDAARAFAESGCDDGLRLLRAAIARFAHSRPDLVSLPADDPRACFSVRYETTIPRQVGLAGSSAIVVATLRALATWYDIEIPPAELAELALAAELEDLGIAAGAMDRVIQAYEGLLLMDLAEPRSEASYRQLDPGTLPPLFLAWDPCGGESSGRAHGGLRARWLAGDRDVLRAIEEFRALVDEGVATLASGDRGAFLALMNRNFDLRDAIFPISDRDRAMVDIARGRHGAAKLCGSGGAVIGTPRVDATAGPELAALEAAYRAAGFAFARPVIQAERP